MSMKEAPMALRIKELRELAGLTQDGLAAAIGKSTRAIQTWERGEKSPNAECIWLMCETLHTDPNTLLGWYEVHPIEQKDSLTKDESVLVANYRACDKKRKDSALVTVSALAESSEESEIDSSLSEAAEAV